MLSSLVGLLSIGAAAIVDRAGFSSLATSMLRATARRAPRIRHMVVGQMAYMAERRGELEVATETLRHTGPPALEAGFYFAELGNLLERQRKLSEAADAYQSAMHCREELSPEFVEWLQSRVDAVQ